MAADTNLLYKAILCRLAKIRVSIFTMPWFNKARNVSNHHSPFKASVAAAQREEEDEEEYKDPSELPCQDTVFPTQEKNV
ncbi:hypothetical protein A4A49_10078 [Nicotiana attenuata]|uniref:Uncharacterized protein n=1 Tax=Nicotiana attenuata TaxID=49451 RepID=A0A314LF27_NICAT|nr:hypothetical protein A4A49_10078 [Nicotiana attenuata]